LIITTCPGEVHNGVWRHLKELEGSTGITKHVDTEILLKNIPNDTKLIISGGGWINKYQQLNTIAISNNIKSGLLYCSPFGQTDLCNEHGSLKQAINLLMFGQIDYLFTGEEYMAEFLRNKLKTDKVLWLPQTIDYKEINLDESTKDGNKLGLFCNSNPNKNILNQVVAASVVGKKLVTNALTTIMSSIANEFSVDYEMTGWLNDEEYLKKMVSVDVGLQVSWSESFDYVAAEMSLRGIPVVTGKTISWNHPELIVDNNDDAEEISIKLKKAFNQLKTNDKYKEDVRANIIKELDCRSKIAKENLEKVLK